MAANVPWVEKYRPQNIDDIVQQDEVVKALRSTVATGDLPHLIFHGPPGTGKTSTALALCRTIFKPEEFRKRVMELNASDERGIDAVRNKVKQFAQLSVPNGKFPYKIVILDEADSMTKDAQSALRRIIETHSSVTRFIIVCNYISKIIDPILSRCAKFRFKALDRPSIIDRLRYIMTQEGINVTGDDAYETLVDISGGDLRKAITFAQSAAATGEVSSGVLASISGTPDEGQVAAFFSTCLNGNMNEIKEAATDLVYSGFDISQVLAVLARFAVASTDILERDRPQLVMRIAEADAAIIARADPLLQMLSIATAIMSSQHA